MVLEIFLTIEKWQKLPDMSQISIPKKSGSGRPVRTGECMWKIQKSMEDNITKPKDVLSQLIESYHFAILLNVVFMSHEHF